MPSFVAALHFLLAFTLVGCLACELALLNAAKAEPRYFRTLARIDVLYGASAGLLLAVGLLRAFQFEKGWAFYSHSWPFVLKLTLFAVIALLSIYPTVQFFRARRGETPLSASALNMTKRVLLLELAAVAALIACASLAAKGLGTSL